MNELKIKAFADTYSHIDNMSAVLGTNYEVLWTNAPDMFSSLSSENFGIPYITKREPTEAEKRLPRKTPRFEIAYRYGLVNVKSRRYLDFLKNDKSFSVEIIPTFEGEELDGYIVRVENVLSAAKKLTETRPFCAWGKYAESVELLANRVFYCAREAESALLSNEACDAAIRMTTLFETAEELASGTANLREIIRYSTGKNETREMSISESLARTLNSLRAFIKPKSRPQITEEIEPDIIADVNPKGFSSAISNLVINGLMYGLQEFREVNVTLSFRSETSEAVISVADKGMGISPEKTDLLFEPFASSRKDRKNEGLGLVVVKLFCESVGGRVSYTSSKDEGSTFVIVFPAHKGELQSSRTRAVERHNVLLCERELAAKLKYDMRYGDGLKLSYCSDGYLTMSE